MTQSTFGPNRRTRWSHVLALCPLFFLLAWPSATYGQGPVLNQVIDVADVTPEAPGEDTASVTAESIGIARDELAATLEAAQSTVTEETAQQLGIALDALQGRVDRLRALDGLLQQQLSTVERVVELTSIEDDLAREIAAYEERGLSEAPPYTLGFAEILQDEATAEERHLESLDTELASLEGERESAIERLAEAQRTRRAANEAATQNEDPALGQGLTWSLNRAKLEERHAQALVDARRLRHSMISRERAISEKRLQHLRKKADAVMVHTEFSREELDERLAEVAALRAEIESTLENLRETHQKRDSERSAAREKLQAATDDEARSTATMELALYTLKWKRPPGPWNWPKSVSC